MANNDCVNCPVHNISNLQKLGVNMESWDFVVALAGNPNTGKSTVFNALTGLRQHTGNCIYRHKYINHLPVDHGDFDSFRGQHRLNRDDEHQRIRAHKRDRHHAYHWCC